MTAKQILRTAQAFHRAFRIPANDSSSRCFQYRYRQRRMQRLSRQVSRSGRRYLIQRIPIIRLFSFDADNVAEVSTVLEQYYTALSVQGYQRSFAVTDNLTAEEQAQIEAESDVESYGDVKRPTRSAVQARRNVHRVCQQQMQISEESTRPCRCFRSIISTRQKTAA